MKNRPIALMRGTTLVELIVTLTIASSIFLMATAWIHQSMFLSSKMRELGRHHQELMRLSRQFRDDVHFAAAAEMNDEGEVSLYSDDQRIQYSVQGSRVTRHERRSDDDSLVAQETYRMRDGAEVSLAIDPIFNPPQITLLVERSSKQQGTAFTRPLDLSVRSKIGRLRKDEP